MIQKAFTFLLFALVISMVSCRISKDPMREHFKQLQKGIIKEDTSFIYSLPYDTNKTHLLVQGYFSRYSHKNRAALDFKMKKGTRVLAARNGIVLKTKADGTRGGWNRKYRPDGNYVTIQHDDGSIAGYWHLQHNGVLVKPGDVIKQGQVIGLSGRTGYALFPHLHFVLWRDGINGRRMQMGSRFKTSKGIRYLRPFRWYRNKTRD